MLVTTDCLLLTIRMTTILKASAQRTNENEEQDKELLWLSPISLIRKEQHKQYTAAQADSSSALTLEQLMRESVYMIKWLITRSCTDGSPDVHLAEVGEETVVYVFHTV